MARPLFSIVAFLACFSAAGFGAPATADRDVPTQQPAFTKCKSYLSMYQKGLKCKSYLSMYQKGLVGLPATVASTSTDMPITSNMHFDADACFKWAQDNRFHVALVEYSVSNAPAGTYRCTGKAVPFGSQIGAYVKPKEWWKSAEYVGPYTVPGEDFNLVVPKSWWALGAQTGLDKCDMYSIQEGGWFNSNRWWPWTKKECKVFPKADERSLLILAKECERPVQQ